MAQFLFVKISIGGPEVLVSSTGKIHKLLGQMRDRDSNIGSYIV